VGLYLNPDNAGNGRIHALLIGAADYPVRAGRRPSINLGPLPAIEKSVTRLADWLLRNSAELMRPIGSIEMLLSSATPDPQWQGQPCAPPTQLEMSEAVERWIARCEADAEGSIALVYFGGHGFFRNRLHFFASDAANYRDPGSQTVRLNDFVVGMSTTQCRRQIFIFDCCQDLPEEISRNLTDTGGTALIDSNETVQPTEYLIVKATSPGLQGLAEDESYLIKILLQLLDNDGADRIDNNWWVTPASMLATINQAGVARYGADWPHAVLECNSSTFTLRRLSGPPMVDISLGTMPAAALPEASVRLEDFNTRTTARCTATDSDCSWDKANVRRIDARVPSKFYVAEASFDPGETRYRATRTEPVWPKPFRDAHIKLDVR
jgi:hypothetical protein